MFLSHFTVKPIVQLPGDVTPELSENEDEDISPTDDLLDLTNQVRANAVNVPAEDAALPIEGASSGWPVYKGKGKGVGKGCSGSSGPLIKRRRKAQSRPPPEESSDSDAAEEEKVACQANATQTITVRTKRGYTTYPAYLFDITPRKLCSEILRKKLMIAEIHRSNSQRNFYDYGVVFMGFVKEFFCNYFPALQNLNGNTQNDADHGYVVQPETQENANSEVEN